MSCKDKDEKKTPNSTNALFLSSKRDRYSVVNNGHSKSHNWRGKGRGIRPPKDTTIVTAKLLKVLTVSNVRSLDI